MPAASAVGGDALGHAAVYWHAPAQGEEAAVGEFHHARMDAADGAAGILPAEAVIGADVDRGAVLAARSGVAALQEGAVAEHKCACNDLMPDFMPGLHQLRQAPGPAVVVASAHAEGQVLPVSGVGDAVHVQQRAVGEMRQRAAGHVPGGHREEEGGGSPSAFAETGAQHHHFAAALLFAGEPYCQEVAVVAPGDGRLMVVAVEWGFGAVRGDDEGNRLEPQGSLGRALPAAFGLPDAGCLAGVEPWLCSRERRGGAFDDPETYLGVPVGGDCGHPGVPADIFHRGVVAAAPGCREALGVEVGAPFLHVAEHVVEAVGIGAAHGYRERDDNQVPLGVLVPVHVGGEGVGAAGEFPLLFGGEGVELSGPAGQPVAVGEGVVPADVHHGLVVGDGKAAVSAKCPVRGVEGLVLGVCDFGGAHAEGCAGEGNLHHRGE